MTPKTSASTMFKSARSSGDAALIAFATTLLAAFVLHAGAFLPRLSAPRPAQQVEMATSTVVQAAPAVVAGATVPATPRG